MGLKERVGEEIERLNPRLMELARGEVELVSADEETGTVTIRIFRGFLITSGYNACSLWADKLLKEAVPEIREINCVYRGGPGDPGAVSE